MTRVSLFLKEKQIRKLKALAKKQDDPWSHVTRHAIDFYLKAIESEDDSLTEEIEDQPEPRGAVKPVMRTKEFAESTEIKSEMKGDKQ